MLDGLVLPSYQAHHKHTLGARYSPHCHTHDLLLMGFPGCLCGPGDWDLLATSPCDWDPIATSPCDCCICVRLVAHNDPIV